MAHSLRKYLSNRGSALFMVISTMTALMIACMAMYFSVISARTTQFATFFREQSYQSAVSLNDMLLAGLMDGTLTSGDSDLLTTLSSMSEGDTITTGANGFSSFDSTLTGADIAQMGAYSMDITRLPNEMVNGKDNMTFDIATTTINNGVADTVHTYIHIDMTSDEPELTQEIFAATGLVPNDTYLDAGKFLTDVFFDSEYTFISLYNSACVFAGDLKAGGSVIINHSFSALDGANANIGGGAVITGRFKPVTWVIRGDFKINFNGPIKFKAGSKIYVGGDLNFPNGGGFDVDGVGDIDVYVLGNLNTPSSGIKTNKVNLYVNGDISTGQIGSPESVHVNGAYKSSTPVSYSTWDKTDAMYKVNNATGDAAFPKWVINGEDDTKSDYLPGIDATKGTSKQITIALNSSNGYKNGVDALSTVFTIAHHKANSAISGSANEVCVAAPGDSNASAAIIREVIGDCSGQAAEGENKSMNTIILDTGEDANNVLYLRVKGYLTDDDGNSVFKWFPGYVNTGATVLVKGKGSVVIDIPEGVIYQDADRQQFMHYSWFTLLGGTEYDMTTMVQDSTGAWGTKACHVYNSVPIQTGSAGIAVNFIHATCKHGDGCSYYTYTATDKSGNDVECTEHPGTYKIGVRCSTHGGTSITEFCPECNTKRMEMVDDLVNGTYDEGVCSNRLDKAAVDAYCLSKGIVLPGNIYPKTDIFLVNSSESAEIRLSGHGIIQNGFYGFVYAPYMTFKAEGSSGNGANRLLGALIVSDYAINDHYAFTTCYPEKMPYELMGESSNENLAGLASKGWKIGLGSY